MLLIFMVWLYFQLHTHQVTGLGQVSVEQHLYNDLFKHYNQKLRPVTGNDFFKPIDIDVGLSLLQIEDLNEKDEQLTTNVVLHLSWVDELLQWNITDYYNASSLVVPAHDVWLPELILTNSVRDANELAFDEADARVSVYSNGRISWIPLMRWKTACSVNITAFPYDTQECLIRFTNWMYAPGLLNFKVNEVAIRDLEPNSGWNLEEITASDTMVETEGLFWPFVIIKIKIKRNPLYFELNVLLPAILLSFLLMPMFILPVESGEKVSLGVTLMLSYCIFLLMLAEYTPQSGAIPSISVAMLACFVFAGLGILSNVLIINIHYHMPSTGVPQWIKYIILAKVGNVVCRMNSTEHSANTAKVKPCMPALHTIQENESSHKDDIKKILRYLEFFRTKLLDEDQLNQNREEWNKVARVLDRIFLILYLIYFLVYLLLMLSYKWSA